MLQEQGPACSRQVTWKFVLLSALLLGTTVGLLLRIGRHPLASEDGSSTQHWHSKVLTAIVRQLLVICVSAEAHSACLQTGATCFHDIEAQQRNSKLAKLPPVKSSRKPQAPQRVQTPVFLQIGWDKLECLHMALSRRVSVLFVDSDIVWLTDPLPALQASQADVQLTHDGWGPNIGVMFVRPTDAALAFMHTWRAQPNRTGLPRPVRVRRGREPDPPDDT
ncbi:hypothetical protein WJX73_005058 [Symbiochloris irregularis]|uniref:Nucleotide-diphospho-sugar transferase domain-containing protein n=1 Tax=Symbiochloris irregularis TaxID=706552 RepID=A0AAW1PZE0_9CHLO